MNKVRFDPEAISVVGCNIATGIAIEKLIEEEITDKKIFLNVFTLWRNFLDCLEGNVDEKIRLLKFASTKKEVYDLFIEDTNVIINKLNEINMDVNIYYPNYKEVLKKFNSANDNVKGWKYILLSTQSDASKVLHPHIKEIALILNNNKLPLYKDMYILTHIGLDLLPFKNNNNVNLIESHTGEIKKYNKWYTKLRNFGKNNMSIIPFNEITYRIFGDGYYIAPVKLTIKKMFYTLAKKNHWNSIMSLADTKAVIKRTDTFIYNSIVAPMKF